MKGAWLAQILWGIPVAQVPTPEVRGETPRQWFERATPAEQRAWLRWATWFPVRLMVLVFAPQIIAVTVLGWESPEGVAISFTAIFYGFLSISIFRLSLNVKRWAKFSGEVVRK